MLSRSPQITHASKSHASKCRNLFHGSFPLIIRISRVWESTLNSKSQTTSCFDNPAFSRIEFSASQTLFQHSPQLPSQPISIIVSLSRPATLPIRSATCKSNLSLLVDFGKEADLDELLKMPERSLYCHFLLLMSLLTTGLPNHGPQ